MPRPGLDSNGAAPTAEEPRALPDEPSHRFWRSWSGLTAFVGVGLVVIVLLAIFSLSLGTGTWADVWRGLASGDTDTTAVPRMHGRETATQQLTPDLVRVVLSEGDLDEFRATDFTDAHVDIAIRPPGALYDEVFDPS